VEDKREGKIREHHRSLASERRAVKVHPRGCTRNWGSPDRLDLFTYFYFQIFVLWMIFLFRIIFLFSHSFIYASFSPPPTGSSQSPDHSKRQASPETPQQLVSIPFSLQSTPSPRSIAHSHHSAPQQPTQLPQLSKSQPSTDVIDVAKLARQDQPPPAYENVDERIPSNASCPYSLTRASRPLPMPPLDRHNSSSAGTYSTDPSADVRPAETYETSSPVAQSCNTPPSSASSYSNTILPTHLPFSSLSDTSQPPVGPLGKLQPHDPSSLDWIDRNCNSILPLSTRVPSITPSQMGPSESDQHTVPSDSCGHDSSWTQHQPLMNLQQAAPTTAIPSRPVSLSGSVQSWSSLPPPYFPPEVSSSRNSRRPFSEPVPNSGVDRIPPSVSPALASRGLPPPAPPTILDPPPVHPSIARSSRAPHEPFLSDAPPPPDSWIAVETSSGEYRLIARLPGFRRDAMFVFGFVTSVCSLTQSILLPCFLFSEP
jgi:hypothetical protein